MYAPNQRQHKSQISGKHLPIDLKVLAEIHGTLSGLIQTLEGLNVMKICGSCNRDHHSDLAAHRVREILGSARNRIEKVIEVIE